MRRGKAGLLLAVVCLGCSGAEQLSGGAGSRQAASGTAVGSPAVVDFRAVDPDVARLLSRLLEESRTAPTSGRSRGALGMAYEMSGYTLAARDCYLQAAALDPEEPRWPYLAAIVQADLGDLDAALESLDSVFALHADYLPAYLLQGWWLLDLGRTQEAGAVYAQATRMAPGEPAGWIGIARVHLRAGRSAEALPILERLVQVIEQDAYLYQLLGQAFRMQGEFDRAADALARAAPRTAPGWPDPWRNERLEYRAGFGAGMARATRLLGKGEFDRALGVMTALRRERPGDRQLLNNLAVAHNSLGQADEALEVLLDGAARYPSYYPFHVNISAEYYQRGDLGRALTHLDRALEINPTLARTHERKAVIFVDQQRLELAREAYEMAARYAPDRADYRYHAGAILERFGRWEEAVERHERAVRIDPGLTAAWVALVRGQIELNRFDAASETLAHARALAPGDPRWGQLERRLSARRYSHSMQAQR